MIVRSCLIERAESRPDAAHIVYRLLDIYSQHFNEPNEQLWVPFVLFYNFFHLFPKFNKENYYCEILNNRAVGFLAQD